MATINFYLKEPNSKLETSIYLAFSAGQKRFKFYTTKKILPKNWNADNQEPKRTFTGSPELKSYLNSLKGETEKILTRFQTLNQPFTLNQIKAKLDEKYERKPSKAKLTFLQFIEGYIASVVSLRSPKTIQTYRVTLKHLIEFQHAYPKQKVDFDTVNLDFYNGFVEYLMNSKLQSQNTVGKQIKNLKVFLNEATERGLNTKLDYRSKRFKVLREDSESIYLTEQEIEKLFELELPNRTLERVRDLFIVGCYTGLRFSDFSQIKPENIQGKFISIRTIKTQEAVVVPIHWLVEKVMKKYQKEFDNSLPPALSNQKMNQYLKQIGKLADLNEKILITNSKGGKRSTVSHYKYELLTTHTARRSFATNLFLKKYPAISLMKVTGHKTERAFLTYIKVSQEENAEILLQFWHEQQKLKVV